MSTSINYPTFRYNNESLVLLPGSRFTKKELISRLYQMNIDSSNIQDKNSLINLYETSLHNNVNKTKILDKLRKDTEILNSKLGISQRQSLQASNMNTMSNNSKTKVINITTEVKPFTTNSINNNVNNNNIREINMKNRGEMTYNPLMSHNSNVQSNKTSRFGGYSNNDNNDNRNSYNDNYLNSGNFQNNNLSNNSSKRYNNTNTGNEYYNNQNESNYQNNFDNSMNTGMNNNNNDILNKSNMNNMNNSNDMYRSRAYNNNNNNSQYYPQHANTDINTSNSNRYNQVNNRNSNRYTNDGNNNYSVLPSQYQDGSIFESGNNTNPYRNNNLNTTTYTSNYAATNNNSIMNMNNNNQNRTVIDSQRRPILSTGEDRQREPDEESEFSIFSTFKNSPLFKDREEICKNLIISLIIIIFAIVTLSLAIKFWDSITNFFYEFFNMLLDPRRLIVDGIFGFISSLFFGSIHYFYITFPLIAIIIFLVIYMRKYNIKKRCEKIYKKMYKDLVDGQNNNEMNFIYEDDLYKKYAANYGISEKEFKRSYLPVLNKMRRRENKMKVSEQRDNNGKKIIFWHLNNN